MKSYSTKSNAIRAAKSALKNGQFEIVELTGGYTFIEVVEAAPAQTFAEMVQEIHDAGTKVRQEVAAQTAAVCEIRHTQTDDFHSVTEKEHAFHRGEIKAVSTTDRPCKQVWTIAESMPGMPRKEVIAACVRAGIAYNTARTQYQTWFSLNK